MGNSVLYGLEDYARDRYGVGVVSEDVFHRGGATTRLPTRSVSGLRQGKGSAGDGAGIMTADELSLIRCLEGMSTARKHLSQVLNQPCRYDETSAPLYSILQKQYEREVAMVVGRAYAAATNAGGSEEASAVALKSGSPDLSGIDDGRAEPRDTSRNGDGGDRPSVTEWYAAIQHASEAFKTERKEKHT